MEETSFKSFVRHLFAIFEKFATQ